METFLYMLSKNYVLLSSGVIIEVRVYWNSLNRQFNWSTNILNEQIFQSILKNTFNKFLSGNL